MKVLYISGREPTYTRNSVFIKALKMKGFELIECTSSARNYPLRYLSSVYQFVKERDYDLVFVGFFGQPLVPIIKCMTKKPVILDAFISGYDTMCSDRKRFSPDSCMGRSLYWLDKLSCELADYIICDTNAHVDYFCKQFSLDKSKFVSIFVGAEDDVFFPRKNKNGNGNGDFNVLYYGSYLPLHGTEYVIRAAKKLEAFKEIKFTIIGTGMMKEAIREEAKRLRAGNITFVDWVPYDVLPEEIAKADLCLGGHFSNSEKARRVIAGKTFQMIAAGKPVIVGDNSANRELFTHRENAFFTSLADENALADAIVELKDDDCLREEISKNAYRDFQNECNLDIIGEALRSLLEHSALLQ
jgi:glycosyltransferase involved in cell wall biosynthesis